MAKNIILLNNYQGRFYISFLQHRENKGGGGRKEKGRGEHWYEEGMAKGYGFNASDGFTDAHLHPSFTC